MEEATSSCSDDDFLSKLSSGNKKVFLESLHPTGMKKFLPLLILFLLPACISQTASQQPEIVLPVFKEMLSDLGPAPELTNDTWLNVDAPLRLADLRGKVVAIDMWTFD